MTTLLSEKFGLYRLSVEQTINALEDDQFFYDIDYLDEDGSCFAHHSNNQPYPNGLEAFKAGMIKLAEHFWQDLEEIAGNGIRTHDILLGNFPITVKSSESEAQ